MPFLFVSSREVAIYLQGTVGTGWEPVEHFKVNGL